MLSSVIINYLKKIILNNIIERVQQAFRLIFLSDLSHCHYS
jgi:hypothetical protein